MVLIAIAGLHALAVAGLMHMGVLPTLAVEEPALQAVFLSSEPQPMAPRPELQPEFEPPPLQLPVMQIPAIQMPAETTSITVAWVREPPRAAAPQPVSNVDVNVPVPVEAVDYQDQVRPHYPLQAKRARAQGTVYLRVIIDPQGRPREVHIERSSGFDLLDHAACEAMRKSLFRPYRENGVARSASAIVPVRFSLNSRNG